MKAFHNFCSPVETGVACPFQASQESAAWRSIGQWRQLYGSFKNRGLSIEWHDFYLNQRLDWAKSFHPDSIEICLNITGAATIAHGGTSIAFRSMSGGFYCRGKEPIEAHREANQQHQFITVEYAPEFLHRHLARHAHILPPALQHNIEHNCAITSVGAGRPLSLGDQHLIASLRTPPVQSAAQSLWFECKAVELFTQFVFQSPESEFFCTRQKRLAKERVGQVSAILRKNIVEPPSLEEISRKVGCSSFYLSRTFSKEIGMSITQYIRQLRLEKAAELLRSGEYNVTEAAFEVGYSSLSYFSSAFHEMFGCCPGLYPIRTPSQRSHRA